MQYRTCETLDGSGSLYPERNFALRLVLVVSRCRRTSTRLRLREGPWTGPTQ